MTKENAILLLMLITFYINLVSIKTNATDEHKNFVKFDMKNNAANYLSLNQQARLPNTNSFKNNNAVDKKLNISYKTLASTKRDTFQSVIKSHSKPFQFSNLLDQITENISNTTAISNGTFEVTEEPMMNQSSTAAVDSVTELPVFQSVNTTLKTESDLTTTEGPSTKLLPKNKTLVHRKETLDCSCDLTINACDIHCCCDNECTNDDLNLFPKCNIDKNYISQADSQYCYPHEIFYKSNSPWIKKSPASNLFCVLKENLPPRIEKDRNKVIKTVEEISGISKQFYKWSKSHQNLNTNMILNKPYNYSDAIWFVSNNTLRTIEIPYTAHNAYCHTKKPLRFLENSKTNCISLLSDLTMFQFYENFDSVYVITNPSKFNESWLLENKTCPDTVCLPVAIYLCNFNKCNHFNGTELQNSATCDDVMCLNIITSMKFVIYANSSGVVSVKIFFGLENIYISESYVNQDFEIVTYLISNVSVPRPISGHHGYLLGKPIIASSISNSGNKSDEDLDLNVDYFNFEHSYPMLHVVAYPKSIYRHCILSNITYNEVTFGENIKSNCEIVIDLPQNIDNATFMCDHLQKRINTLFLINGLNEDKIYLSSLGNPSHDIDHWVQLIANVNYKASNINGNVSDQEILNCENLCTTLKYEFFYASSTKHEIQEYKLLGGMKTCAYNEKLQFEIITNKVIVPLSVTTMFFDISLPPFSKYATGPNLNLQLPKDFFYPFMSNVASMITNKLSYVMVLQIIAIILFCNYCY